MTIPIELLITTLVTPILGAIATLFWLLNRAQNVRVDDRDAIIEKQDNRIESLEERIRTYEMELIPAQQRMQEALAQMVEMWEQRAREDRK